METYQSFNFNKNLIKLRSMAKILNKDGLDKSYNSIKNKYIYDYIILIHNFLIIEHLFQKEISDADYELNSLLNLSQINNVDEIIQYIKNIMSMEHLFRDNFEAIPGLKIIRDFIDGTPEIFAVNKSGTNKQIRMKNGSYNYLKDDYVKNKQVRKFKI